ncbi:MAG: FeoA domain-containing protein [bacterium]
MQVGRLTESLEDYLEVIFRLLQNRDVVRVRDIAKIKDVKTSSVISALQRLDRKGLVVYRQREYVDLTEEGRSLGFRLFQRHTFLKRFLTDFLQVDPDTAERDACSMEHTISVETLERISSMSQFLTYSGKVDRDLVKKFSGDWLGYLEKTRKRGASSAQVPGASKGAIKPLSQLGRGEAGYIARIVGEEEQRQSAVRNGLHTSASVRLVQRNPDGSVEAVVAGETLTLDPATAASILVWREEAIAEPHSAKTWHRRTLADITPGRSFRVVRITATGEIRQRMTDMGFIRGAEGRILREALLRDPIEIQINGSLLSMRRSEASCVVVEELDA